MSDKRMRSIQLWACGCGTQFKALTEAESSNADLTSMFVCPNCDRGFKLDGVILECFEQVSDVGEA